MPSRYTQRVARGLLQFWAVLGVTINLFQEPGMNLCVTRVTVRIGIAPVGKLRCARLSAKRLVGREERSRTVPWSGGGSSKSENSVTIGFGTRHSALGTRQAISREQLRLFVKLKDKDALAHTQTHTLSLFLPSLHAFANTLAASNSPAVYSIYQRRSSHAPAKPHHDPFDTPGRRRGLKIIWSDPHCFRIAWVLPATGGLGRSRSSGETKILDYV